MQTITLNNGHKIPVLGLGTWKAAPNQVGDAVRFSIKEAGYRHIDCALIYENEAEIGEAFADVIGNTVKREELFVTSKLWNTHHRADYVEKAVKKTLSDLRLDYLDLYLMHWGIAFTTGDNLRPAAEGESAIEKISVRETWEAMENLVQKGLVNAIGVANFMTVQLVDLLTYATIKPAMNQIELHPYNTQEKLIRYCLENNIAVTGYSPLGRMGTSGDGKKFTDEAIIIHTAEKYKKSPAQILLRWAIQRGTVAIPKSVSPQRIRENIDIFDFSLTDEEQSAISALNHNHRFVNPGDWWGIPYFS